jgi:alcohol dehydrogenase class IV
MKNLNSRRPLLLSTLQQTVQAKHVKELVQGKIAALFSEATMHTPVGVTKRAVQVAQSCNADSIVSIGGSSTIGLGKAISERTGLHHVTIPTTRRQGGNSNF